jgi:gluconokinase
VSFIFLDGSRQIIAERMAQRHNHYMPRSLLESQLQTLERPDIDEPDVLRVEIDQPLSAVLELASSLLQKGG